MPHGRARKFERGGRRALSPRLPDRCRLGRRRPDAQRRGVRRRHVEQGDQDHRLVPVQPRCGPVEQRRDPGLREGDQGEGLQVRRPRRQGQPRPTGRQLREPAHPRRLVHGDAAGERPRGRLVRLTGEGAGREDHRVQRRDHGSRRGGIRRPRQREGRRIDRARRLEGHRPEGELGHHERRSREHRRPAGREGLPQRHRSRTSRTGR